METHMAMIPTHSNSMPRMESSGEILMIIVMILTVFQIHMERTAQNILRKA